MSTDVDRFYAVLGVGPTVSEEEIRGAFRRRAKELHPDSQSGDASAFILLKRAYDTLSDPELRAAYDRACQPAPRPPPRPQADVRRKTRLYRDVPRPPLPPRTPGSRPGGVSFVRYAIAFLIMAAISLGGVQVMIAWTAAPPSIQTRTVARAEPGADPAPAYAPSTAPGSSTSGFWDPTPSAAVKKTP